MRQTVLYVLNNRLPGYSEKESESNDILIHFVEFSSVDNKDPHGVSGRVAYTVFVR